MHPPTASTPCLPAFVPAWTNAAAAGPITSPHLAPAPSRSEVAGFDDMLRLCVGLSGRLKLGPLLRDAELLASYAGDAGRQAVAAALEGA